MAPVLMLSDGFLIRIFFLTFLYDWIEFILTRFKLVIDFEFPFSVKSNQKNEIWIW